MKSSLGTRGPTPVDIVADSPMIVIQFDSNGYGYIDTKALDAICVSDTSLRREKSILYVKSGLYHASVLVIRANIIRSTYDGDSLE